jgi:hypothetical protein
MNLRCFFLRIKRLNWKKLGQINCPLVFINLIYMRYKVNIIPSQVERRLIMRKKNILIFAACVILSVVAVYAAQAQTVPADSMRPHLETRNGVRQLIVDGKPFLILGGELHNSSSSSLAYMKPLWPILAEKKLNTVLAAVSWELIEPEEGKFDFTLVDGLIHGARQNQMHLVLLWFGSWKNGVSSYPPYWVKTDSKRFPLVQDKSGKTLNILSTFGAPTRDADARAFGALMRHIREVDGKEHTVVMMQVENEVGVLGESRDFSPAAKDAFEGQVPGELMNYIQQHRDTLASELLEVWKANAIKTSGTWTQVFGEATWSPDSIFMAWNYAHYINKVAETGKAEYNIPMYVNAWLDGPNARPGQYPSGGPLPQVADIWRAGAPSIDFQSPDIYPANFDEICERFTRNGNPLFIPETVAGLRGAENALNVFLKRNGIGFSPFGIESSGFGSRGQGTPGNPSQNPLAQTYAILDYVALEILNAQGKNMIAFLESSDSNSPPQIVKLGDYTLNITYGVPPASGRGMRGFGSSAAFLSTPNASPARFVICCGPGDYLFVGGPMSVTFTPNAPGSGTTQLASFDESMCVDGRWVSGRRLNGDETGHNTRWPAMRTFGIYRYRIYQKQSQ